MTDLIKVIPEAAVLVLLASFVVNVQRQNRADRRTYDQLSTAERERHSAELEAERLRRRQCEDDLDSIRRGGT